MALSTACEQLAQTVNDPEISDHPDPWYVIGEYALRLGIANSNIYATRECQQRQRKRLAKG